MQGREEPRAQGIRCLFMRSVLTAELDGCGRHLVSARLVRRRISFTLHRRNEPVSEQIRFNFFTADVRKHFAIHFNARTEELTALIDHFLPLHRVVDDVAVFEGQIVFPHDGAHALAPTAGGLQIGNNLRLVHSKLLVPSCHKPVDTQHLLPIEP